MSPTFYSLFVKKHFRHLGLRGEKQNIQKLLGFSLVPQNQAYKNFLNVSVLNHFSSVPANFLMTGTQEQHPGLKGEEVYAGSGFQGIQSVGIQPQDRNIMVEG